MVRYFGPDNGSAYVFLPNGKPAVGRVALVYEDEAGLVLADILGGDRETQGAPITSVTVDATGRLNYWFPDENPVTYVSVNDGPLVRVTADLQDQLDDAVFSGGGVTIGDVNAAIAVHSADTTAVHGIANTASLETTAGAQSKADAAQAAAASDATTKANAAQSAAVASAAADATAKVAAHVAATDPHGDRAYTNGLLAAKADLVGGKVPSSQIPAIAITTFLGNVASEAAMLALTGELGDFAIRTDTPGTWIITGSDPTQLSSWTQTVAPGGGGGTVTSVNGNPGPTVVLAKGDIGLGNVDNTADSAKPVSTAQQAALDTKQPLDADLTALAALNPANDDVIQRKAGAWANRAPSQLKTDLALVKGDVGLGNVDNTADASKTFVQSQITNLVTDLAGKQPLDSDLTTIASLTATTDNMIQSVAGAWASRTPAQVKTALALNNVNNTTDAGKPISTATQTALDAKADLVGGVIPTSQIPTLAITEVFTVASQAAMLALTAQRGDMALRTDTGHRFVLSTDSPSTLADWVDLGAATDAVASVNGQTGVVVLAKGDIGLGNVSNALQLTVANNLSDLNNAGTARTNLGLGGAAVLAVGTTAGTVAAGDDSRITGAQQRSTLTAKGDLYVATASGTVARQAVGANGDVLRANSTPTNGVEWVNSRQTQTWAFTGTAAVTTGKARWYNRTGRTLTLVGAWVAANTQPTGAAILADVNKNGTTVFTTQGNRPTVAVSTNGGGLSATPDVTSLADGDYLTVDIDQIGSTVAGADVTVGVVFW